MTNRLHKLAMSGIAAFMCFSVSLWSGVGNLNITVPKTAYIQWLLAANDPMTSTDGDNSLAFDSFIGGASAQLTQPANKDFYIGIMCNSLAGYNLTLTAANGGATASTGRITISGGSPIIYTGSLSKVTSSFTGGTTTDIAIDLTGGSPSASTLHNAEADLPMSFASPNVWKLTLSLPTRNNVAQGLIMAGTYSGGITATVSLK